MRKRSEHDRQELSEKLNEITRQQKMNAARARAFTAIVESIADGLDGESPQWVTDAEIQGVQRLPATMSAHFPASKKRKKQWDRARDGLSALLELLKDASPEERDAVGRAAFEAIAKHSDPDLDAGAALAVLLSTLREEVARSAKEVPTSDRDLRQKAKLRGLAMVFDRFGIPIGMGPDSPFVATCERAGVSRTMVRANARALKEFVAPKVTGKKGT